MDKKKIGILVVVGIFLAGISILAFIIAGKEDINNPNNDNPSNPNIEDPITPSVQPANYIVIDNTDMWKIQNNYLSRVDEFEESDDLYNVYINNNYFGQYNLKYGNTWNLFSNDKYVSYNGNLFAFTKDINVKVRNNYLINNVDSSDIAEIKTLLNDNTINLNYLSVDEKIIIDLDQNGVDDKIVSVSNITIENIDNYFNLVYVVLNNEIYTLINEKVEPRNVLITPIYNLNYIINIDNNYYDSIILKVIYYSNSGEPHNILYQFQNNKFIKKID